MGVIREVLILEDQFSSTMASFISETQRAASAVTSLRGATAAVDAAALHASGSVGGAGDEVENLDRASRKATSSTDELTRKIKNLVGTYVGLKGLQSLLSLSDEMASTTARLDMMNDGLQTTAELNQMIFDSAQRSRGAYQSTADMVAKLGNLAGEAFGSTAEIVAFAEQINKQMTLSGASNTAKDAAMLQLTQAMSSGALRGEELNSILEQTPTIAKTIAEYLGVTTGEMRELASEGAITAEVVKNAMFNAAAETNAKFEQMPMTWGQVWTSAQNIILQTFQPVLDFVGEMASFISDHMDEAIAVFYGLAAAVAFYAAAQWIADAAAKGFFKTLLTNPITWIALAIGVVVGLIYQWVQSVGGLKIAWQIVVDKVLYGWDTLKAGFFMGVYWVQDLLDQMSLKFMSISISIQNFMGDMKVGVLNILQSMVNGAIDIINWFIGKLNKIPGVSIDAIEKMTFATTAAAKNEAEKSARADELAAAQKEVERRAQERADQLQAMWDERDANTAARQQEIADAQKELEEAGKETDVFASDNAPTYDQVQEIGGGVGSIAKSIDATQEDIKSLVDVAERRYVNQINLTSQTPVINVYGHNTGNKAADRRKLADDLRDILMEQISAGASISTAYAHTR
mgnify:CR=1 FL=1